MGRGQRRHNTKAKANAKKNKGWVKPPHAEPTSVHDLPNELLDRVFLALGSPLHLVCAAATCRRWRRSIADAGFLVRFRSIHGAPPMAGHYYLTDTDTLPQWGTDQWYPRPVELAVFVPSSSPAVVDDAHFSLDFLYEAPVGDDDRPRYMYQCGNRTRHNRCREIVDSHGSLLLLRRWPLWLGYADGRHCASDFVVCEPLTRRCQGIAWPVSLRHFSFLGAFLLDGGSVSDDAMSNFRVLLVLYERDRPQGGIPRVCLFTPGCDGGWRLGWHPTDDAVTLQVEFVTLIHVAGRAAGRIYWGIEAGDDVLVLDEGTLKFSLLALPRGMRWPYKETNFRVIGSADGGDTVRVVRLDGEELQVFGQLPWSRGEWVIEKSVRLSDAASGLPGWRNTYFTLPPRIVTAGDTFVVLTPTEKPWLFSVELDTMELERVHERNRHVGPAYPCALPWPPVLQACVDLGVVGKRRQRRTG